MRLTNIASSNHEFDWFKMAEFVVPPIEFYVFKNLKGSHTGIQGRKNSCYLDSTLFSLFAFSDVLDPVILMEELNKCRAEDCGDNCENCIRTSKARLLLVNIVNVLRQNYFCPAEPILKFRDLLVPLNQKLNGSFMDVEELMLLIFEKVFHLNGFLTYDTEESDSDFIHQIDISGSRRDRIKPIMTTQKLLEISMHSLQLNFKAIPQPVLILQMPRSNGKLIGDHLKAILPNLALDLTNLISGGPKKCWVCGQVASLRCSECFDSVNGSGMESSLFCNNCSTRFHLHPKRRNHSITTLTKISELQGDEIKFRLVAVICIRHSHFVSFARTHLGHWVFSDSRPTENKPKSEILEYFDDKLIALSNMSEAEITFELEKMNHFLKRVLIDSHILIYGPISRPWRNSS